MGPKKETKNFPGKREYGGKETVITLDDPINSDSWKCVVLMAVEKSSQDIFLLKEFEEEAKTQSRPKIQVISYYGIIKLVNDFIKGEIRQKYAFILNFLSVFQEAGEYLTNKSEIPIVLQVKLIKAMLFYFKEENLIKTEKDAQGAIDPIQAMAERPLSLDVIDNKKKDSLKKGDVGLKVKPSSLAKQDTELLKRGEGVKDNQCFSDAPLNGYFNIYVLLIEFYSPELPLELIKAGIPLHSLICIDTSLSLKESKTSFIHSKSASRMYELKSDHILKFWNIFLKFLWNPDMTCYFRNIIFQVYTPRRLLCEKKERREFIYRELSYLMYDMSDYKKQLDNYLANMKLREVEEKAFDMADKKLTMDDTPSECVTVPIILQCMMDAVCGNDLSEAEPSTSTYSDFNGSFISATEGEQIKVITSSIITRYGSCLALPDFQNELLNRRDPHMMNIYLKAKALDIYYNLDIMTEFNEINSSTVSNSQSTCHYHSQNCSPNLQELLSSCGSALQSIQKRYKFESDTPETDYILYSIFMTRVQCPYEVFLSPQPIPSLSSFEKNSDFELIENINNEMRKPLFTITDGSRHVMKSIPYNLKNSSKDFFSPTAFKVISPAKLKASSAPVFRVIPALKVERSFLSDVLPNSKDILRKKDLFMNLREFMKESLTAKTNGFNYLEVLNKSEIINKEIELQNMYNCIDHTYSIIHNAVFVAMHNRMDNQNSQHETFNEVLKTGVGLRDFFEYILEDEAEWFETQKEALGCKTVDGKSVQINCLDFTDSDFWMTNSIKSQFWKKGSLKTKKHQENQIYEVNNEKSLKKEIAQEEKQEEKDYAFEGYDISEVIVQFSGMKTVFYSNDCNITVELIERLYGDQILGVHVSEAGHTLHLYSYACPEPHIKEPFTFHLTYRNGVIVAFGRRFKKVYDEIEEAVESKTTIKSKKNSSEGSSLSITKKISKMVIDEEFQFDLSASLPNGLKIQTVVGMKPCCIRQLILSHPDEGSRLCLPNGNVIKMMNNKTVQIFKIDTSIITAELNEFVNNCSKYETVYGDGLSCTIQNGKAISSKRFQVFQNTDMVTNRVFFRRGDGTNYFLQGDGTLCVKFNDKTKVRVFPFIDEDLNVSPTDIENSTKLPNEESENFIEDYVIVHLEITVEHPDYATTIYNTKTRNWKLLLPYDSGITIHPEGEYCVNIDNQTDLIIQDNFIEASRFSTADELLFQAVADLSAFNCANMVYVTAKDYTGKKFIVEANSNCYVENDVQPEGFESNSQWSGNRSTQIASTFLLDKGNELTHEKKYFVIRNDMSGFELLDEKSVTETLTDLKNESVIFTHIFPDTNLRCFVLISPRSKKSIKKWEVKSILPEPKYVPNSGKQISSTTYGIPPSWMHPFPKRKTKFEIPQYFSCRVFLETKPTGLKPGPNKFACSFCEVEVEPKPEVINWTKVEEILLKLKNNDQDILREMYTTIAAGVINKTKKENLLLSEKLAHYLRMSEYYVEMQEFHKKCIRYHKVPKYFDHPVGMSYLILNALIGKLKLPENQEVKFGMSALEAPSESPPSEDSYSLSEIDYNLSIKTYQSFSSLSYHSSKSGQTAPGVIETQGICKCKIRPTRNAGSTPAVDYNWTEKPAEVTSNSESVTDSEIGEFPPRVCDFWDSDFDFLNKMRLDECGKGSTLALEDLMNLGLM